MSYSDLLKDPRWQHRRQQVIEAAHEECQRDGKPSRLLEVHHHRYRQGAEPWEYFDEELAALCPACHQEITRLKRRLLDLLFLYEVHFLPLEKLIGYIAAQVAEVEPDSRVVLKSIPEMHGVGDALGLPTAHVERSVDLFDDSVDVAAIREEMAKARSTSKLVK